MKYFLLICLFLLVGCSKKQPVPTPPMLTPPPKLDSPPRKVDPVYSVSYVKGYNDGYAGTWLAPGRWVVVDDYRAGRSAGVRDRQQNLPNKFEK
jgi:hypothetical protein